MSEYDLRRAFPLNEQDFTVGNEQWTCHLAEVSDMRPDTDELSWYLVFEEKKRKHGDKENHRKLEIVTNASGLLAKGWRSGLKERLEEWLQSGESDGRKEWREG
ncbi:MAG TPA: hypothetical protein VHZ55_14695 [Bryobacteraceae bacterium]|jgi:hypothetical protein|nr:hypothetical protein [Bryobacteraceae bacterium]